MKILVKQTTIVPFFLMLFMFIPTQQRLMVDPVGEVRALVQQLGLPVQEERLACLAEQHTGKFLRQGDRPTVPFTTDHHR